MAWPGQNRPTQAAVVLVTGPDDTLAEQDHSGLPRPRGPGTGSWAHCGKIRKARKTEERGAQEEVGMGGDPGLRCRERPETQGPGLPGCVSERWGCVCRGSCGACVCRMHVGEGLY